MKAANDIYATCTFQYGDEYCDEFFDDPEFSFDNDSDIRAREIAASVGAALREVGGILDLKSGVSDIFKKGDDLSRGVSVGHNRKNNTTKVSVRVIANSYFPAGVVIDEAAEAITNVLESELKFKPQKVEIEIAESMTENDFNLRYAAD